MTRRRFAQAHFPRRSVHVVPDDPALKVACQECGNTQVIPAGTPALWELFQCSRCEASLIRVTPVYTPFDPASAAPFRPPPSQAP